MKKYLSALFLILLVLLLRYPRYVKRNEPNTLDRYSDLGITPLPDAVPIYVDGKTYILSDPTTEFKHGVLGDAIEAKTLTIINGENINVIKFSPQVFEGLYPLLADIDGEGGKEIIATLSGNGAGAQIVIYNQAGETLASTESLSSGWRHVLGVAPFGPSGELELVDISKPHVLREVEFFQFRVGTLVKVASIQGFSTHKIGSRNMDIFEVVQIDGRHLLIVPTADFQSVAAIGRTLYGVEEVWRIDIGEEVVSISFDEGRLRVNGRLVN
jgi:hypothetical protein